MIRPNLTLRDYCEEGKRAQRRRAWLFGGLNAQRRGGAQAHLREATITDVTASDNPDGRRSAR